MKTPQVIALDMDGTITQHRTHLEVENRKILEYLSQKYRLVIVGAGSVQRIFNQLQSFPADIIGCYGMEISLWDRQTNSLKQITARKLPVELEKEKIDITNKLRKNFGYNTFTGDGLEFHDSGMLTFPLLGVKAAISDKLAFDPDRSKRKKMYQQVCDSFCEYTVFIGGSSSFDIVPKPFNKLYALDEYCQLVGLTHNDIIYFGDDYDEGGNDWHVYKSDIRFIPIPDYRRFGETVSSLL